VKRTPIATAGIPSARTWRDYLALLEQIQHTVQA
jgi:hypothetical protein